MSVVLGPTWTLSVPALSKWKGLGSDGDAFSPIRFMEAGWGPVIPSAMIRGTECFQHHWILKVCLEFAIEKGIFKKIKK